MSVDVNYYSFSPSRADKRWVHFVEDLSVLRKRHAPWHQYEKDSQEAERRRGEIETKFELRIDEIRKKIFNFFDERGYIIPWVEWSEELGVDENGNPFSMTDEDKMDYLDAYGCVYPREARSINQDTPYLMLGSDAPKLHLLYNQVIKERDKMILSSREKAVITPAEDESVVLNKRQAELDRQADLSYLKYETKFDEKELIFNLKELDLYYGSIENEYFESPKLEEAMLEIVIKFLGLEAEGNLPTRNGWLELARNLNNEIISAIVNSQFVKQLGWEEEEARLQIKHYFRAIAPVLDDIKKTHDAIFVRTYEGSLEVEPEGAELTLLERAKKHRREYEGKLLPVL